MFKLIQYQVALSDGRGHTYANAKLVAADDTMAKQIATEWASQLGNRREGAWLVLNTGGRVITLKPGEF
jgi:hypothetical protein